MGSKNHHSMFLCKRSLYPGFSKSSLFISRKHPVAPKLGPFPRSAVEECIHRCSTVYIVPSCLACVWH